MMSNQMSNRFDTKFNEISSDINKRFDINDSKLNEQKIRCEISFNKFDAKFNEIKGEINIKVIQQLDKLGRNIENKVSNNVSHDDVNKSEILLNKINGDMLSNSCDNESRKLVDVSNEVVISTDELEKEWRDS